METAYYRNDNGLLMWFELDFSNIIELRNTYLPGNDRHINMVTDVSDFSWMDKIVFSPERGIFLIAGGLFMYFVESQVRRMLSTLANRFSGGELIFDGSLKFGAKITNKRAKKARKSEMTWKFAVKKDGVK